MSDLSIIRSGFPPPISGKGPDLLVIAGEHSGDQHAARLISGLLENNPDMSIVAIGGPAMAKAGAQLLFDLTHSSVVGIIEVLKSYRFFKSLFACCVHWIEKYPPKAVCFVDYPGFNLRLAAKLCELGLARKSGGNISLLYYISPQIWAWKAKRRFKMSEMLDTLGVIFPFEIKCYEDTSLSVNFVGHPFVSDDYRLPIEYSETGSVLLLPGSRKQAVGRILPIMLKTFSRFHDQYPESHALIIYPSEPIRHLITGIINKYPDVKPFVTCHPVGQQVQARALLTSSGTISLASALAGVPGAIVYRAHLITYLVGKRLLQIPYLGIANILLDKNVYPEYIQGDADPVVLTNELADAWKNPERKDKLAREVIALRQILSVVNDNIDVVSWAEEWIEKGSV